MHICILRWYHRSDVTNDNISILYQKDKLIIDFFNIYGRETSHVFLEDYDTTSKEFKKSYSLLASWLWENAESVAPGYIFNMITNVHDYVFDLLEGQIVSCNSRITRIANNKYTTYGYFPDIQPHSQILADFYTNNKLWTDHEEVILKPIYGSKWTWVQKLTIAELFQKKEKLYDYGSILLVQEFLDTKRWYPWLCESTHDIRIYCVWDQAVASILRWSAHKDEFRAWVNLWWTAAPVDLDALPQDLTIYISQIISTLTPQNHEFYCIDFAYCSIKKDRALIEINSVPWFRLEEETLEECKILSAIYSSLKKYSKLT